MNRSSAKLLRLSAGLALAMLGNAQPVRADEAGTLTFSWEAPEGCPSRYQVSAEIARLLGGSIRVPQGGDIKARG